MNATKAVVEPAYHSSVEIDKLASASDAYEVIESIRGLSSADDRPILLDFRNLALRPAERINAHWTEIVANKLLTEFYNTDIVIRPPSASTSRRNLERFGCAFAIRQRSPSVTHIETDQQVESWPAPDWGGTWSPYDSHFRQRICAEELDPDVLLDGEFVTFLNPHAYAQPHELDEELTLSQAGNWILRLVKSSPRWFKNPHELESHDKIQNELARVLRRITYELVSNLRYAFCGRNVIGSPRISTLQHSYVQMYTTRGGRNSFDRLHFIAADTGFGIIATLLPKLAQFTNDEWHDPVRLIEHLILRQLPPYGRNSGQGYQNITKVLQESGGDLYLTTGPVGQNGVPQTIRAHARYAGSGEPAKLSVVKDNLVKLQGTTVRVVLRLG